MPISKDDFEHGLDEEVKKVLNFLSENEEKAFTSKEISDATKIEWNKIRQVLGYLNEMKRVKSKDIGAYRYYIFQTRTEKKRKLFG
jgi:transcription initiation factor IIE alpha subunit